MRPRDKSGRSDKGPRLAVPKIAIAGALLAASVAVGALASVYTTAGMEDFYLQPRQQMAGGVPADTGDAALPIAPPGGAGAIDDPYGDSVDNDTRLGRARLTKADLGLSDDSPDDSAPIDARSFARK